MTRAYFLERKYKNMYMYDNQCIPTIKPTSMELSGTTLQITLPSNISLLNGKKWHLLICQSIPQADSIGSVVFVVKGVNYPAMNGIGNTLKTDMLCPRRRYTLVYGWDAPHFMVCGTKPSAFIPSTAAANLSREQSAK